MLVALLVLGGTGCDGAEERDDFGLDASRPADGITRTDADCTVDSRDEDDWRTAPDFSSVTVEPPCPNPVRSDFGGVVRVGISVPFAGTVRGGANLLVRYRDGDLFRFALLDQIEPGLFPGPADFTFTLGQFAAAVRSVDPGGLYRLYVEDGTGRLVSYGDLLVE